MNKDHEADHEESGVGAFAKRVLRSSLAQVPAPVRLDTSPGIRWLRKHGRETDPKAMTMCRCKGCHCTRLSVFKMPCFQCTKGQHRRSTLSKRDRRERAEVAMVRATARADVTLHRSIRKPDGHRTPALRRAAAGKSKRNRQRTAR